MDPKLDLEYFHGFSNLFVGIYLDAEKRETYNELFNAVKEFKGNLASFDRLSEQIEEPLLILALSNVLGEVPRIKVFRPGTLPNLGEHSEEILTALRNLLERLKFFRSINPPNREGSGEEVLTALQNFLESYKKVLERLE